MYFIEEDTKDKGKFYKPTSKMHPKEELLTLAERTQAFAKLLSTDKKPDRLGKTKKSGNINLEAFMEELKQIQEREERHKREEEKAAAHVFQEFVETFQEAPLNGSSKVWIKAGTYDARARKEDTGKGKFYKPTSKIQPKEESLTSAERAQAFAKLLSTDKKPDRLGKTKKSGNINLEALMEELKQIQEEREERHKYKVHIKTPIENELDMFMRGDMGSFDNGDPNTTTIYIGNLNPKLTEPQLMEIFGRFGPLASIKIMWPRSDEEKARGRNCGFVAYMYRKDGERALKNLNGKDIFGYEMKLGWGKAVIPRHPIYIPPVLREVSQPPPPGDYFMNCALK